jgi:bacteriocin-like protein
MIHVANTDLDKGIDELSDEELASIAGGRFKRPLQPPIDVYYDDGISVWTSEPSSTNVIPNIK